MKNFNLKTYTQGTMILASVQDRTNYCETCYCSKPDKGTSCLALGCGHGDAVMMAVIVHTEPVQAAGLELWLGMMRG